MDIGLPGYGPAVQPRFQFGRAIGDGPLSDNGARAEAIFVGGSLCASRAEARELLTVGPGRRTADHRRERQGNWGGVCARREKPDAPRAARGYPKRGSDRDSEAPDAVGDRASSPSGAARDSLCAGPAWRRTELAGPYRDLS